MKREDLWSLERLLLSVDSVVPMRDIHAGEHSPDVIGMRHDVDDNQDSFVTALRMAEWEAGWGFRSTYFLLHSASYWKPLQLQTGVEYLQGLGHEVGIHVNALAEATRTGRDPLKILERALVELRAMGAVVTGSVAHGDEACYEGGSKSKLRFVNDEIFTECARPEVGAPDRTVAGIKLDPQPMADFGLQYDSNRLPRKYYASDSGGNWSQPWGRIEEQALSPDGQLHMLIHPDWWADAFV